MWLPSTRGDTSNLSNSKYIQSYSSFKTQESDAAEYLKQTIPIISRNLLKQFKISLESNMISTQKLCFECVQTFGARICQLVNRMEENIRNTKVKNLVQRATIWICAMQRTAFLGMLEAKVTSMWKSAKTVSQKLGNLSGHQMDTRVNTNFCTQIWKM